MKGIYYIIILIFSLSKVDAQLVISSNSVGPFTSKMNLNSALKIAEDLYLVESDSMELEGDRFPIYNLIYDGIVSMKIEPDCEDECKVWRYWIYGDEIRTKEDLGIGNTIDEFLKVYTLDEFLIGEGSIFFTVKELEVSMMIDQSLVPDTWWTSGMDFDQIPKSSTVSMIIFI